MTDQRALPDPSPEDVFSATVKGFHAANIREIWARALARRIDDPANAITLARTLLESVCKIILDGTGSKYAAGLPLPKLYEQTAKALSLAPNPSTEDIFRKLLTACADVVWGVGQLRNFLSDSHGHSGGGTTPDWRHAELAINLAGTMATYLYAIWENRQPTIAALIDQQIATAKESGKPFGTTHEISLRALRNRPIANKIAAWLTIDDLIEHCQQRVSDGVDPATVNQDVTFLSAVFTRAKLSNEVIRSAKAALTEQGLIGPSKQRMRRPTPAEIQAVLALLRESDRHHRTEIAMTAVVEFAATSGRLISEITELRWKDLDRHERTCKIDGEEFPLLGKAYDIAVAQPQVDERIFPYNHKSAGQRFTEAKQRLHLDQMIFNDLRLEAICRLLEAGYGIHEVADAVGQKDHNIIARIKRELIDLPRNKPQ